MSEYFANVGSNLSKSNQSDISQLKIFSKSIMQSFMLHEFTESEVSLAISDVKTLKVIWLLELTAFLRNL